MRARTSSGSAASEAAVKPTRSQKRTETTLRSSCTDAAGRSVSGAAQKGQNGNSPGSSLPQEGQVGHAPSLGRATRRRHIQPRASLRTVGLERSPPHRAHACASGSRFIEESRLRDRSVDGRAEHTPEHTDDVRACSETSFDVLRRPSEGPGEHRPRTVICRQISKRTVGGAIFRTRLSRQPR